MKGGGGEEIGERAVRLCLIPGANVPRSAAIKSSQPVKHIINCSNNKHPPDVITSHVSSERKRSGWRQHQRCHAAIDDGHVQCVLSNGGEMFFLK